MKKFLAFVGFIALVLGAIASGIAIYHAVKPGGPAKFSGSIGDYTGSASFISFLKQNNTKGVNLNVICKQPASHFGCQGTTVSGTHDFGLILYANPAAAACWNKWNNNKASTCSGGVLITFSTRPGASGTFYSPGAGYYSFKGDWRVSDVGTGITSPEGDDNYELYAIG